MQWQPMMWQKFISHIPCTSLQFKVLYRWTYIKGRAHMHFIDTWCIKCSDEAGKQSFDILVSFPDHWFWAQDLDRTSTHSHSLATSPQHTQSWVSKVPKTNRRPFLLTSVLLFLYFHIFHLPHQLLLSLTKVQQQYGVSNLVRNVDEVSVFQIHNITFDFPLEPPHLVVILKADGKH